MPNTNNFGWNMPTVFADSETWGTELNALFQLMDEVIYRLLTNGKYAIAGGTGDALTLDHDPALTELLEGQRGMFKATAANTTGVTADVDGLGAEAVKTRDGAALPTGYLVSGQRYKWFYDGTDIIVDEPLAASTADALAGTSSVKLLTAAALGGLLSIANPGYLKIPGGFAIMFGSATVGTDTTADVNLPLTLTGTANGGVIAGYAGTIAPVGGSAILGVEARFLNTSQIRLSNDNVGATLHWIAWGPI